MNCKHANRSKRQAHLETNPRFNEGRWIKADGYLRWSQPYLVDSFVGVVCRDCGERLD